MRAADDSSISTPPGVAASRSAPADGSGADTYDIDAEIRLSRSDLVLTPTITSLPPVSFSFDVHSWAGTGTDEVFVTASGGALDGLDAALDDDATVADYRTVAAFDTERLYRVTVSPDATRLMPAFDAVDAVVREVRATRDGWSVRAYVSARSVLTTLTDRFRAEDLSFDFVRLSRLGTVDDVDDVVLSEDQRELLAAAIDHGYFETPRGISQHDLASMFDVSPSAISQRLRTATGKLVAHNLGAF
ncbi:helix-turn-helix domain-containing protein [Halosimplex amylolyticum]|uniref:helix-turn-helix domain-containing protein n=1 Tax=Halosimplex amylolyticum TaxID=3396616 RepID=UPI003F57128F